MKECYKLRTCYVNFAEHLQNSRNVNFIYSDAPGTWGTPFTGWGEDMRYTPDWDGTFAMLIDPAAEKGAEYVLEFFKMKQ